MDDQKLIEVEITTTFHIENEPTKEQYDKLKEKDFDTKYEQLEGDDKLDLIRKTKIIDGDSGARLTYGKMAMGEVRAEAEAAMKYAEIIPFAFTALSINKEAEYA